MNTCADWFSCTGVQDLRCDQHTSEKSVWNERMAKPTTSTKECSIQLQIRFVCVFFRVVNCELSFVQTCKARQIYIPMWNCKIRMNRSFDKIKWTMMKMLDTRYNKWRAHRHTHTDIYINKKITYEFLSLHN